MNNLIIIGAGPSGLTLAYILHTNNIPCTIFEADASPNSRSQVGTRDLHPKSGQAALKAAGLLEEFIIYSRADGAEDMIICDKDGKRYVEVIGERDQPEIDRLELRRMLIEGLPRGCIKWGSKVKSVEVGIVHLEDGKEKESGFDLIVGADGAWSKVRPLLTHIPLFYSGVSGLDIALGDADERHPEISKTVGRGSMFAFGEEERRVMLCQRLGDKSVRCYAFAHSPENCLKENKVDNDDDLELLRHQLLTEYKNWSPDLQRIITDFDTTKGDDITPRALYMLPVGIHWPTTPGLTLIGDAAHLMTPFAGQGVNMAMLDALELAQQIIEQPEHLAEAVQAYEEAMFPRAKVVMERTWQSLLSRFAPGGIAVFKEMVRERLEEMGNEGAMKKVKLLSEN
ncbi:putative monooxygenase [Tothia fuscella]|uniref:Monooxygenase n=1 Tax=Tothia fuscella TaxID=1048955 RepID=A0A9P4NXU8_9PEZI|nr:putative monooxygenase [Tothia fuscella]